MLLEVEKYSDNYIINKINGFLRSNYFLALVGLFMSLSAIFGLELFYYYLIVLIAIYSTLFAKDFLHFLPITISCYMTFSRGNNPYGLEGNKFFNNGSGLIQLIIIASIILLCFIIRIIYNIRKKENISHPKFFIGLFILGITYVLGGLFSNYYKQNTILFGFVELLSITIFYVIYSLLINKENIRKDYFAYMLLFIGIGLMFEIVDVLNEGYSYIRNNGISFDRYYLYAGWGMNNNVGCIMALCITSPLYLVYKSKRVSLKLLFQTISFLFMIFTVLIQGRSAILTGMVMYLTGIIYIYLKGDYKTKVVDLSFNIAFFVIILLVIYLLVYKSPEDYFYLMNFSSLIARKDTYTIGFNEFKNKPIFGNGFFWNDSLYVWGTNPGTILPPRFHNTFIQLLTSCGVVGLCAYLYHRIDTIIYVIKERSDEIFFVVLAIGTILLTSIFDCHFFNIGPGIIYSCLLFFIEAYRKNTSV